MSPHRYGKIDSNQTEIVAALRACGCSVFIANDTIDLIAGRQGQNYLLELKAPGGRLTKAQEEFRDAWRGQFAVVSTIAEALSAVGITAGPIPKAARVTAQTEK